MQKLWWENGIYPPDGNINAKPWPIIFLSSVLARQKQLQLIKMDHILTVVHNTQVPKSHGLNIYPAGFTSKANV